MYGWAGKILHVDLDRGGIRSELFPEDKCSKFIGGRGTSAKLLWNFLRPRVDPYSPENVLIFGIGPLVGTIAPMTGRTTITYKSPLTNLYCKSSMGGHFAGELKFAGYDHIIIHGKSDDPVYLFIKDETVELLSASHLWGMDVKQTTKVIREQLNDEYIQVTCIGPAGENLVRFASIMNMYNAAARGGGGAVMGSKNLKAVAVKGTGLTKVKDPERLARAAFEALGKVIPRPYGTSALIKYLNDRHILPSYNFKSGYVENGHMISGEYFAKAGFLKRKISCFSCPVGCHLYCVVQKGPYACATGGPEYETCSSLGSGTGVAQTDAVIKSNELCNILGLDTISSGTVIQWAMECYERGVLSKDDADGLDLKFGSAKAQVKLVAMIAHREGNIGNLLAEGCKRAAERVGRDSWKWAMCNSKGLEQSRVDTRHRKARALAFSVNPRGPDHLFHQVSAAAGRTPEARELTKKITGLNVFLPPTSTEHRAVIVRWYEDRFAATEALGICKFSRDAMHTSEAAMSEMFSAVTGIEVSPIEILTKGRSIYTLERCFNVREGFDRKLDDLPWRMMHEPADWPNIPPEIRGHLNSPEELHKMQDEYYTLHGWDVETGWPRKETLSNLGLDDIAKDLEKMGKLPE